MPIDYYPNLQQADLESLLLTLQDRQTSGIVVESNIAGFMTRRAFGKGMSSNEVEIRRVLYSLSLRAPGQYKNPYSQRITRTRARYTFS